MAPSSAFARARGARVRLRERAQPRFVAVGVHAVARRQDVELRLRRRLGTLRVRVGHVEPGLAREQVRAERARPRALAVAHEHDGVHLARRQLRDLGRQVREELPERAHRAQHRLRLVVAREESELALDGVPRVGREVEVLLVEPAPPHVRAESVRPRGEHRAAGVRGAPLRRARAAPEVARLLHEAVLAGEAPVEQRLRGGMRLGAHRVERVLRAVRREERIGMRGELVHQLALEGEVPLVAFHVRAAVHAAHHRTRRVLGADGGGERMAEAMVLSHIQLS